MSWLFAPFAVFLGVVLTTQVATNALLGSALGNNYIPAAVNMAIGLDRHGGPDMVADPGMAVPRNGTRCAVVCLACRRLDGNDLPHRKHSSCPAPRRRRVDRPRRRRAAHFLGSA